MQHVQTETDLPLTGAILVQSASSFLSELPVCQCSFSCDKSMKASGAERSQPSRLCVTLDSDSIIVLWSFTSPSSPPRALPR